MRSVLSRRWISPEPLNVVPALVGLPLAIPWRRALAMGLDLIVVALLSGVSAMWLLGRLLLLVLQLRSQRDDRIRMRPLVGWLGARMATGGLGFAQMLWDVNRQALQDKAAHTAAIDLRVPRARSGWPADLIRQSGPWQQAWMALWRMQPGR